MCHLRSQPIQAFVAGQQLRNTQQVLEKLLGSRPRVTMEAQLEAVFSMWSAPTLYHASYQLSDVAECQSRLQPSRVLDVNCE
jgi:hypothetical protein